MSITSYATLEDAIAGWIHPGRTLATSPLASQIPDFISLAEAKLNRRLRLRAMENSASGTVAATVALPTGYVGMRSLTVTAGGATYPLPYTPPENISSISQAPDAYSIVGENLVFQPSASGYAYTLTYFKAFTALSAGANWLITNAPDVYLYASLVEAANYIRDAQKLSDWAGLLEQAISQLSDSNKMDRYGSSLMVRAA